MNWKIKLTAFTTAVLFGITNTAWSQPSGMSLRSKSSLQISIPEKIEIPSELGTVEAEYRAPGDRPFVVVLQDAHAIADAQLQIQRLIVYFQEKYGIDLVALEGGKGAMDATLFRTFPDEMAKKRVMAGYLEKGEITGAGMAAVFGVKPGRYYGIEDWELYEENYLAYARAAEKKPQALEKLQALKSALDQKRPAIFSAELNRFHSQVEAFHQETLGLDEFLKQTPLSSGEDASRYPHLSVLMNSLTRDESLQKEDLRISLLQVAEAFRKKALPALQKKQAMEFNERFRAFQSGEGDHGSFLRYLVETGASLGFAPHLTVPLQELLEDARTLSSLRGSRLLEEIEHLIRSREEALAKTGEEKELLEKYRKLSLLRDLASLELRREQAMEYQKDPQGYLALIANEGILAPAIQFYKLALERDQSFRRNLKDLLKKQKSKTAVVLAGGFHARGFEEGLKADGYSYAVIMPKINSLDGKDRYAELMQGKLSYKSYLRTTFYDAFVRASSVKLVGELSAPDFRRNLKVWRDEVIRLLAREGRTGDAARYTDYIDRLFKVYYERFGEEKAGISKEEILKAVEEELQKFRKRKVDELWSGFQSQLDTVTGGLKSLIGRNALNLQNVSALLEKAKAAGNAGVGPLANVALDPSAYPGREVQHLIDTGVAPEEIFPPAATRDQYREAARRVLNEIQTGIRSLRQPEIKPAPQDVVDQYIDQKMGNNAGLGSEIMRGLEPQSSDIRSELRTAVLKKTEAQGMEQELDPWLRRIFGEDQKEEDFAQWKQDLGAVKFLKRADTIRDPAVRKNLRRYLKGLISGSSPEGSLSPGDTGKWLKILFRYVPGHTSRFFETLVAVTRPREDGFLTNNRLKQGLVEALLETGAKTQPGFSAYYERLDRLYRGTGEDGKPLVLGRDSKTRKTFRPVLKTDQILRFLTQELLRAKPGRDMSRRLAQQTVFNNYLVEKEKSRDAFLRSVREKQIRGEKIFVPGIDGEGEFVAGENVKSDETDLLFQWAKEEREERLKKYRTEAEESESPEKERAGKPSLGLKGWGLGMVSFIATLFLRFRQARGSQKLRPSLKLEEGLSRAEVRSQQTEKNEKKIRLALRKAELEIKNLNFDAARKKIRSIEEVFTLADFRRQPILQALIARAIVLAIEAGDIRFARTWFSNFKSNRRDISPKIYGEVRESYAKAALLAAHIRLLKKDAPGFRIRGKLGSGTFSDAYLFEGQDIRSAVADRWITVKEALWQFQKIYDALWRKAGLKLLDVRPDNFKINKRADKSYQARLVDTNMMKERKEGTKKDLPLKTAEFKKALAGKPVGRSEVRTNQTRWAETTDILEGLRKALEDLTEDKNASLALMSREFSVRFPKVQILLNDKEGQTVKMTFSPLLSIEGGAQFQVVIDDQPVGSFGVRFKNKKGVPIAEDNFKIYENYRRKGYAEVLIEVLAAAVPVEIPKLSWLNSETTLKQLSQKLPKEKAEEIEKTLQEYSVQNPTEFKNEQVRGLLISSLLAQNYQEHPEWIPSGDDLSRGIFSGLINHFRDNGNAPEIRLIVEGDELLLYVSRKPGGLFFLDEGIRTSLAALVRELEWERVRMLPDRVNQFRNDPAHLETALKSLSGFLPLMSRERLDGFIAAQEESFRNLFEQDPLLRRVLAGIREKLPETLETVSSLGDTYFIYDQGLHLRPFMALSRLLNFLKPFGVSAIVINEAMDRWAPHTSHGTELWSVEGMNSEKPQGTRLWIYLEASKSKSPAQLDQARDVIKRYLADRIVRDELETMETIKTFEIPVSPNQLKYFNELAGIFGDTPGSPAEILARADQIGRAPALPYEEKLRELDRLLVAARDRKLRPLPAKLERMKWELSKLEEIRGSKEKLSLRQVLMSPAHAGTQTRTIDFINGSTAVRLVEAWAKTNSARVEFKEVFQEAFEFLMSPEMDGVEFTLKEAVRKAFTREVRKRLPGLKSKIVGSEKSEKMTVRKNYFNEWYREAVLDPLLNEEEGVIGLELFYRPGDSKSGTLVVSKKIGTVQAGKPDSRSSVDKEIPMLREQAEIFFMKLRLLIKAYDKKGHLPPLPEGRLEKGYTLYEDFEIIHQQGAVIKAGDEKDAEVLLEIGGRDFEKPVHYEFKIQDVPQSKEPKNFSAGWFRIEKNKISDAEYRSLLPDFQVLRDLHSDFDPAILARSLVHYYVVFTPHYSDDPLAAEAVLMEQIKAGKKVEILDENLLFDFLFNHIEWALEELGNEQLNVSPDSAGARNANVIGNLLLFLAFVVQRTTADRSMLASKLLSLIVRAKKDEKFRQLFFKDSEAIELLKGMVDEETYRRYTQAKTKEDAPGDEDEMEGWFKSMKELNIQTGVLALGRSEARVTGGRPVTEARYAQSARAELRSDQKQSPWPEIPLRDDESTRFGLHDREITADPETDKAADEITKDYLLRKNPDWKARDLQVSVMGEGAHFRVYEVKKRQPDGSFADIPDVFKVSRKEKLAGEEDGGPRNLKEFLEYIGDLGADTEDLTEKIPEEYKARNYLLIRQEKGLPLQVLFQEAFKTPGEKGHAAAAKAFRSLLRLHNDLLTKKGVFVADATPENAIRTGSKRKGYHTKLADFERAIRLEKDGTYFNDRLQPEPRNLFERPPGNRLNFFRLIWPVINFYGNPEKNDFAQTLLREIDKLAESDAGRGPLPLAVFFRDFLREENRAHVLGVLKKFFLSSDAQRSKTAWSELGEKNQTEISFGIQRLILSAAPQEEVPKEKVKQNLPSAETVWRVTLGDLKRELHHLKRIPEYKEEYAAMEKYLTHAQKAALHEPRQWDKVLKNIQAVHLIGDEIHEKELQKLEPVQMPGEVSGKTLKSWLNGYLDDLEKLQQDIPVRSEARVTGERLEQNYGLTGVTISPISNLKKANVWNVESGEGKFILKKPKFRQTADLIDWEASVLEKLGPERAAQIRKASDGKNFIQLEGESYVLYQAVEGEELDWGEVEGNKLEEAARWLAQMHKDLEKFTPAGKNYTPEDRPQVFGVLNYELGLKKLEELKNQISERGPPVSPEAEIFLSEYEFIQSQINLIRNRLTPEILSTLLVALTHGDFHQANGRYQASGVFKAFDFEYAAGEARVRDLANPFMLRFPEGQARDGVSLAFDKVETFLTTYHANNPLTPEEIEILPEIFRLAYLEGIFVFAGKEDAEIPLKEQIANLKQIDSLDWKGLQTKLREGPLFSKQNVIGETPLWEEFINLNGGREPKILNLTGNSKRELAEQFKKQTQGMAPDDLVYLAVRYKKRGGAETVHAAVVDKLKGLKFPRLLDPQNVKLNQHHFLLFLSQYREEKQTHLHLNLISLGKRSKKDESEDRLQERGLMRPVFSNLQRLLGEIYPGTTVSAVAVHPAVKALLRPFEEIQDISDEMALKIITKYEKTSPGILQKEKAKMILALIPSRSEVRTDQRPGLGLAGAEPTARAAAFREEFFQGSPLVRWIRGIDIAENLPPNRLEGTLTTDFGDIHFKVETEGKTVTSLLSVILNPELREKVSRESLKLWLLFLRGRGFEKVDFEFFRKPEFLKGTLAQWIDEPSALVEIEAGKKAQLSLEHLNVQKMSEEQFQPSVSLKAWPDTEELRKKFQETRNENEFLYRRAIDLMNIFDVRHLFPEYRGGFAERFEPPVMPETIRGWLSNSRDNPLYAIAKQIYQDWETVRPRSEARTPIPESYQEERRKIFLEVDLMRPIFYGGAAYLIAYTSMFLFFPDLGPFAVSVPRFVSPLFYIGPPLVLGAAAFGTLWLHEAGHYLAALYVQWKGKRRGEKVFKEIKFEAAAALFSYQRTAPFSLSAEDDILISRGGPYANFAGGILGTIAFAAALILLPLPFIIPVAVPAAYFFWKNFRDAFRNLKVEIQGKSRLSEQEVRDIRDPRLRERHEKILRDANSDGAEIFFAQKNLEMATAAAAAYGFELGKVIPSEERGVKEKILFSDRNGEIYWLAPDWLWKAEQFESHFVDAKTNLPLVLEGNLMKIPDGKKEIEYEGQKYVLYKAMTTPEVRAEWFGNPRSEARTKQDLLLSAESLDIQKSRLWNEIKNGLNKGKAPAIINLSGNNAFNLLMQFQAQTSELDGQDMVFLFGQYGISPNPVLHFVIADRMENLKTSVEVQNAMGSYNLTTRLQKIFDKKIGLEETHFGLLLIQDQKEKRLHLYKAWAGRRVSGEEDNSIVRLQKKGFSGAIFEKLRDVLEEQASGYTLSSVAINGGSQKLVEILTRGNVQRSNSEADVEAVRAYENIALPNVEHVRIGEIGSSVKPKMKRGARRSEARANGGRPVSEARYAQSARAEARVTADELMLLRPALGLRRVLLVGDDENLRAAIKPALQAPGREIIWADEDQSGLKAVQSYPGDMNQAFDLIIIDVDWARDKGDKLTLKLREMGFKGPILLHSRMPRDMERKGMIVRKSHGPFYWHYELAQRFQFPNTLMIPRNDDSKDFAMRFLQSIANRLHQGELITKTSLDPDGITTADAEELNRLIEGAVGTRAISKEKLFIEKLAADQPGLFTRVIWDQLIQRINSQEGEMAADLIGKILWYRTSSDFTVEILMDILASLKAKFSITIKGGSFLQVTWIVDILRLSASSNNLKFFADPRLVGFMDQLERELAATALAVEALKKTKTELSAGEQGDLSLIESGLRQYKSEKNLLTSFRFAAIEEFGAPEERMYLLMVNAALELLAAKEPKIFENETFKNQIRQNPFLLEGSRLSDLFKEEKVEDPQDAARMIKRYYPEGKDSHPEIAPKSELRTIRAEAQRINRLNMEFLPEEVLKAAREDLSLKKVRKILEAPGVRGREEINALYEEIIQAVIQSYGEIASKDPLIGSIFSENENRLQGIVQRILMSHGVREDLNLTREITETVRIGAAKALMGMAAESEASAQGLDFSELLSLRGAQELFADSHLLAEAVRQSGRRQFQQVDSLAIAAYFMEGEARQTIEEFVREEMASDVRLAIPYHGIMPREAVFARDFVKRFREIIAIAYDDLKPVPESKIRGDNALVVLPEASPARVSKNLQPRTIFSGQEPLQSAAEAFGWKKPLVNFLALLRKEIGDKNQGGLFTLNQSAVDAFIPIVKELLNTQAGQQAILRAA